MTLERLWSGWRAAYVTGATGELEGAGEGCLFCRLVELDDDEAYILERTEHAYTVLNAYPYTSGHLMVAPTRHEPDVEGLTEPEALAVFGALQRGVVAMKAALAPEGVNLGANLGRSAGAGVPGHVHLHALPRWTGDTNFMTAVAEARVLPEDLRTTWERLRAVWPT
ncbi:MAG TPA: HIT domain-containing protein [Acidimicrobiia bacterium]|nr:HIT domain-containing protein [Acidimicrobiia bacterium]